MAPAALEAVVSTVCPINDNDARLHVFRVRLGIHGDQLLVNPALVNPA